MRKINEECAVFGIVSHKLCNANLTFFGLKALQHRGQEASGICSITETGKLSLVKGKGLVRDVYTQEKLDTLNGQYTIGHNRYSTSGDKDIDGTQPITGKTELGVFGIAHNGQLEIDTLNNSKHLKDRVTDTQLVANRLHEIVDNTYSVTWWDCVNILFRELKGAFSMLINTSDGLFAMRDTLGVRPLVLGHIEGDYVVASETTGLDAVGAEYIRDVGVGEVLFIKRDGTLRSHTYENKKSFPKFCIFEMIYFSRPDSIMYEESIYHYRKRLGEKLAGHFIDSDKNADITIGVPDSGTPSAIAFAKRTGIPYEMGYIRSRNSRTFIQPTQEMREDLVNQKLNLIVDVVKDKRVVLIDDSIVRGTTIKRLIENLRLAGAKEIHVAITSPPIRYTCNLGVDMNSRDMVATERSIPEISKYIGCDSLIYLSTQDLVECVNPDKDIERGDFCLACFNGEYPQM